MQVQVIPSPSKTPQGSCLKCWMSSICVSPCFIWRPLPKTNYSSEVCAKFKRFSSSSFSWQETVFLCSDVPYVIVPLIPAGSQSSDVRKNKDASEVPSLWSFQDPFGSHLWMVWCCIKVRYHPVLPVLVTDPPCQATGRSCRAMSCLCVSGSVTWPGCH